MNPPMIFKMRQNIKKRLLCAIILMTCAAAPPAAAKPAAGVSGTLSLIPGLGQAANGNPFEGIAWLGAVVGLSFVHPLWGLNLWEYNMYDAYRDAKPRIGRYTKYNIVQNYVAFFNPLNIIDPIGAPLVGLYGIGYRGQNIRNASLSNIAQYHMVGLGEEALFRGFLFPAFSDVFSSTFLGALTSSLVFGAVHFQYGWGERGIVSLFGLVECWQAHRNKYDLRKNMFAHSWVDVFVSKPNSLNDRSPGYGLKWNVMF